MDQLKIGRFIAECRKSENLTQAQLAERLGITDRAISKWETGRAMPDSAIMLELCDVLKITVNDLLSGEVISMDNYNKEMEQKLIEMVKEKEASDKRLLKLEWVIAIFSLVVLMVPVFVAAFLPEGALEDFERVIILFSGFIPGIAGLSVAIRVEQVAGYYKCGQCGHMYVPEYKSVYMAPHMGRTRYMKCPECGKKSWQKKHVSKDQ